MKKYEKKITHCVICPNKKDNICGVSDRVLAAGKKIQDSCPLRDWQESEPDIFSAIESLKLALDSPTVQEMNHDVKQALRFLGVEIGAKDAST